MLQVLGRGNFFDDVSQLSGMSIAVAPDCFHAFCKKFVYELYSTWIFFPKGDDLKRVMDHYDQLGFAGAMGSTDVTHVHWGRATCSHSKFFVGKKGFPTLPFEATVDHTGRVMACTKGYPGSQNDKTIVRLDGAVTTVRKEKPYIDIEFKLLSEDGTENGKETSYVGVYLIVDRGYHLVRASSRPCVRVPSVLGDFD